MAWNVLDLAAACDVVTDGPLKQPFSVATAAVAILPILLVMARYSSFLKSDVLTCLHVISALWLACSGTLVHALGDCPTVLASTPIAGAAAQVLLTLTAVRDLRVTRSYPPGLEWPLKASVLFLCVTTVPFSYIGVARGLVPYLLQIAAIALAWLFFLASSSNNQKLAIVYLGMQTSLIMFALAIVVIDNVLCESLRAAFGLWPFHAVINHSTITPYSWFLAAGCVLLDRGAAKKGRSL